jgi:hypothetical protein
MSFEFSIGDFVALSSLTLKLSIIQKRAIGIRANQS